MHHASKNISAITGIRIRDQKHQSIESCAPDRSARKGEGFEILFFFVFWRGSILRFYGEGQEAVYLPEPASLTLPLFLCSGEARPIGMLFMKRS